MQNLDLVKEIAISIKQSDVKNIIKSIYLGGSGVDINLNNSHDTDFIIITEPNIGETFAERAKNRNYIESLIHKFKKQYKDLHICIQIVTHPNYEIKEWAYLYHFMQLLVGTEISFPIDILVDSNIYLDALREKYEKLNQISFNKLMQKRWYHVVEGLYMLENNSYELNQEQKEIVNNIHDTSTVSDEIKQWVYTKLFN